LSNSTQTLLALVVLAEEVGRCNDFSTNPYVTSVAYKVAMSEVFDMIPRKVFSSTRDVNTIYALAEIKQIMNSN
jgi:hypothetical protein